jgi:predicted DCC family thiol-disulfide oxidoreductase YuxK
MSLVLVYDGGCPFCRQFALRSELLGGLPELELRDGRADHALRAALKARGLDLARGAVLLDADRAWHGAEAIAQLCGRLSPSDPLLQLLRGLFAEPRQARMFYPILLLARRLALQWKGLPEDPDRGPSGRPVAEAQHVEP